MHQQAGAAIQNFLLRIVEEGLATCWVGHFDDVEVKRFLNIPDTENFVVEAMFPIGKRTKAMSAGRGVKSKPELDSMIYFDKWKGKYMRPHTRVGIERE